MTTLNRQVGQSSDDAFQRTDNNGVSIVQTTLSSPLPGSTPGIWGLRFTNVTIPKGDDILSAILNVNVTNSSNDDPDLRIYGELNANAATFAASTNNIGGRTLTTAFVPWSASSIGSGARSSPDISAIIAEITGPSSSWVSGNALALIIVHQSASPFQITAYDGTPGSAAALAVEHEPPPVNPGVSGLISWWPLNEESGTRNDAHGSNDLTDNNTVGHASGKQGNAADFEMDNSEYLSVADNPGLNVGGHQDFTFAAWVKFETAPIDIVVSVIAGKLNLSGVPEWAILCSGGFFSLLIFDGDAELVQVDKEVEIVADAWYFVVAWHDADANTLNIQINNGTPASLPHSSGILADGDSPFTLGAILDNTTPANLLDGLLDEAAFWKRVLTPGERTWLYNGGDGRVYGDLAPAETEVELSGDAAVTSDADGSLSLKMSLSGATAIASDADGSLDIAAGLSGSAAITSTADADLDLLLALSAAAAIASDASGDLSASIALSGEAAITSGADGELSASGQADLTGTAAITSNADGSMGLSMGLSGSAAITSDADGQLDSGHAEPLSGSSAITSDATADMSLSLSLSGQSAIMSNADGSLDASGEINLNGRSDIVSSADGSMGLLLSLAGSAAVTSGATGVLSTGGEEALSGAAAIVSDAVGGMALSLALSGSAAITSGADGKLEASGEAALSGQAGIASGAQGSMGLSLSLSGSAQAESGADGKIVAGMSMSGQAGAISDAVADLKMLIALSGDAAVISSAVIVTAIIPIIVYVGSVRSPSRRGAIVGPRLTGSVRSPGDLEILELL